MSGRTAGFEVESFYPSEGVPNEDGQARRAQSPADSDGDMQMHAVPEDTADDPARQSENLAPVPIPAKRVTFAEALRGTSRKIPNVRSTGGTPKGSSLRVSKPKLVRVGRNVPMQVDLPVTVPSFKEHNPTGEQDQVLKEMRSIWIPPNRRSALRRDWMKIYSPLVDQMKLEVRYRERTSYVDVRNCSETGRIDAVRKGCEFLEAFAAGFEIQDALVVLRMDAIYRDTFEIRDVRTLHGEHLGRAIGRIAGTHGRSRFSIENASRTRMVLAGSTIHLLGTHQNIRIAKDAVVDLIRGRPPSKVYNNLRVISSRRRERL